MKRNLATVAPLLGALILATACAPKRPVYVVRRAETPPTFTLDWDAAPWDDANVVSLESFHPRSLSHHPVTNAKVMYDEQGIYVFFKVQDRHMHSVHTGFPASAWLDSCCEFFVWPEGAPGYFNFEINCGGGMMLMYIPVANRSLAARGMLGMTVHPEVAGKMTIAHSMPETVDPVRHEFTEWYLEYFVPYELMEEYIGPLDPPAGRRWRANFYKCGGDRDRYHLAAWSPTGEWSSFHQPDKFGVLVFEEPPSR